MTDDIFGDYGDTICAVSTPAGSGGIAVVRVSGPEAIEIVNRVWRGRGLTEVKSHTAHYGEIVDPTDGAALDQCVATVFRGPRSFTGEDTVEISVHGSRWIQKQVLALLIANGGRLAGRGEFTRRAVVNGKLDMAQAEGVADMIASSSRAAHRLALSQMKGSVTQALDRLRDQLLRLASLLELELDFSEEDVEFADRSNLLQLALDVRDKLSRLYGSFSKGAAIKDGVPVAIIGPTNAGKSSLLNSLLDDDRAIVSDIHGTTRDTIEEALEIGDYLFRFIDTAGLRATDDPIERIGISRSISAIEKARIVIVVLDATEHYDGRPIEEIVKTILPTVTEHQDIIVVKNKADLLASRDDSGIASIDIEGIAVPCLYISANTCEGLDALRGLLEKTVSSDIKEELLITNLRQAQALKDSLDSLSPLIDGLHTGLETDLLAQHLRETLRSLASITTPITTPDILESIFKNFCIGK